eukprot:2152800-Prorocentrum_lima.AAC.1
MQSQSKATVLMLARTVVAAGWKGLEDERMTGEFARALLSDPAMLIDWTSQKCCRIAGASYTKGKSSFKQ